MNGKSNLEILDCSLRDGGYYTNWDFDAAFVKEYLKRMDQLPVDFLEIGYRSKPRAGYLGAFFYCPEYILENIRSNSKKKLAIILNEKDIEESDIKDLLLPCQGKIDLVRVAVKPQQVLRTLNLVEKIRKMGFEISLNVMYLSTWKTNYSFLAHLKEFDDLIDYLYLVDSYGGVFPKEVREIVGMVKSESSVKTGFHGHNNLELSLINTLTAIDAGVDIVDATVAGMGRGAGNLKTELLLTVLQNQGKIEVDYDELSKLAGLFSSLQEKYQWGPNLAYMVSGINSLPQQQVMAQISKRYYSLNSIVRGIYNQSKGLEDNLELPELQPLETYKTAIIMGGGPTGTNHSNAVKEFLKLQSSVCIIHASSKNTVAYRNIQQQQYHCLVGNEGYRLEKVYEQLESSEKIAILPPYPRVMGTYIPPSLRNKAFQLSRMSFTDITSESATALAIETALKLNSETIFFIGYDGYEGNISEAEMELFKENDLLFQDLGKTGVKMRALTPTKYSKLTQESVYSYL